MAERTGLENQRRETVPGFESLPLRHIEEALNEKGLAAMLGLFLFLELGKIAPILDTRPRRFSAGLNSDN